MYYIHIYERCDNDPDYPSYWTEWRLSQNKELPEWSDSIWVEEGGCGLENMIEYCDKHNYKYEIIDWR